MKCKLLFIVIMLISMASFGQVVEYPTTNYQYDQKAYTVKNYVDAMKSSLYNNIDNEVINSGSLNYGTEYNKFLTDLDKLVTDLFTVYEVEDTAYFESFEVASYTMLDGTVISEDWFGVASSEGGEKVGDYGLNQREDIIARKLAAADASTDAKDVKNTDMYKSLVSRQSELTKIITELDKSKSK